MLYIVSKIVLKSFAITHQGGAKYARPLCKSLYVIGIIK